jgi:hypothetical protein
MDCLKYIGKIREYCDYLEDHILNVKKSWEIVQEKCKDLNVIYDDHLYWIIDSMIREHDVSKCAPEEFIQYQRQFFPVGDAPDKQNPEFGQAWEHHKANNPHHWETWTVLKEQFPNELSCHCVCMVCDWMAMSIKFGDTPRSFYNKNATKIDLPNWAIEFIKEIFDRIER